MPTPVRLLAVAAILAAALGGAFILGGSLNRTTNPEPTPEPIPTALDDAPHVLGALPAGRYDAQRDAAFGWPGGDVQLQVPTRGVPALLGTGPDGKEVLLGTIDGTTQRATLSATDRCPAPGTYDWRLTDGNLGFEVTRIDDTCADRSTFLTGAWRRLTMVQSGQSGQRYQLPVNNNLTLSFSIPATFRSSSGADPEINVDVDQSTDHWHSLWVESDGPDGLYFSIVTKTPSYAYYDRCNDRRGRGDGPTTIDEFLAWNRATTGATVSEPRQATVAGREGIVVDLTVGPDCPNGDEAWAWWDGLINGMTHRQWAVELDEGELITVGFLHTGPPWAPLTDEQLKIADEIVASITLE